MGNIEIILHNCQIQVMTDNASGNKIMKFIDPSSSISILVPLVPDAARKIGMALMDASIVLPTLVPPIDLLKKNGQ